MERAHIADLVFPAASTRPPPTNPPTVYHPTTAYPRNPGGALPPPRIPYESNPVTYQTLLGLGGRTLAPLPGAATDHPLVTQSRTLLSILAAISLFGASLAFGTFFTAQQTYPAQSRTLVYLAWAFAAFVGSMLSTLIWQVVLASNFHGFEGRLFRSKTAILCAFFAAFSSIAAGVIFLGLALTEHTAPGVRAAGFCTAAAVIAAVFATMVRLCMTVARRARSLVACEHAVVSPIGNHIPVITLSRTWSHGYCEMCWRWRREVGSVEKTKLPCRVSKSC